MGKGKETRGVVRQNICSYIYVCVYIYQSSSQVCLFKAPGHPVFFSSKSGAIRRYLLLYLGNCSVSDIRHQIMYALLKLKKCL